MPATKERELLSVLPWGIEADHPRNCDLYIQSIPNCRLRSAIKSSRSVIDAKTGEEMIPKDQSNELASFPHTPGMQLHVNPEELTYAIVDPLYNNEEILDRVKRWLDRSPFKTGTKINGVPPQKGTIDVHRMKTLCREMLGIVESGEASLVKGSLPTIEDIEELPGRFLLNPGSRVQNTQPLFEDEFEDWIDRLHRSGG